MDTALVRGNTEHKPCSAVDVFKNEAGFGAGIGCIDRLVRIEGGLSRPEFPQVSHALSDGEPFPNFDIHL
jgi:hypothetical protein